MTKPDWGHGPNEPVLMFTEAEIRRACTCDQFASEQSSTVPLMAEQLIAVLKEVRGE
jgi:hypothetical protein